MLILVTYKIQDGEHEYHDYSWFSMGTQSDYDAGVIKDKVLVEEVYGDIKEDEGFDKNTWWTSNDTLIQVYSVQDITLKELDVLDKFGVVHYDDTE